MDSRLQIIALKFLFSVLLWVQSSAFGTGAGKFSEQFARLSSNCLLLTEGIRYCKESKIFELFYVKNHMVLKFLSSLHLS